MRELAQDDPSRKTNWVDRHAPTFRPTAAAADTATGMPGAPTSSAWKPLATRLTLGYLASRVLFDPTPTHRTPAEMPSVAPMRSAASAASPRRHQPRRRRRNRLWRSPDRAACATAARRRKWNRRSFILAPCSLARGRQRRDKQARAHLGCPRRRSAHRAGHIATTPTSPSSQTASPPPTASASRRSCLCSAEHGLDAEGPIHREEVVAPPRQNTALCSTDCRGATDGTTPSPSFGGSPT